MRGNTLHFWILINLLFTSIEAFNQPGLLDPTFGSGGKADITIGNFPQRTNDLFLLPDNSCLILGSCIPPPAINHMAFLCKITKDGVIDSSFASNGVTPFISEPNFRTYGIRIAVQSDNKIIVLSSFISTLSFDYKAIIYRFNPDGTLDTSFGSNGKCSSPAGFRFNPTGLVIDSEGKIIVSGQDHGINTFSGLKAAFLRFLPTGALDETFDTDGKVTLDMGATTYTYIKGMKLLPDGKIFAFGTVNDIPSPSISISSLGVLRLNNNGSLDNTFSDDGIAKWTFGDRIYYANKMKFLDDGKIRVAAMGKNSTGKIDFSLLQLNADGSIDNLFGDNGVYVYETPYNYPDLADTYFQNDGKAILGGSNSDGFVMLRANSDGSLDTTFYDSGFFLGSEFIQFKNIVSCQSLTQLSNGQILCIGAYLNTVVPDEDAKKFAVFRLLADSISSVSIIEQPIKEISTYPNPASTYFTLDYTLQSPTPVTITLYDQTGRKVQTLLPASQRSAGNHSEQFNLQNLAPRIYSLELSTGQYSQTVQLVKK